ncbi:MAG TPA: DedA family protein [Gammaproteobacteria bacterium]|nr:DedA family protein [Gammaproteobacteria bacterium]
MMVELWPLFIGSYLSSTLLPGGSEGLLVGYYLLYPERLWLLLGIASIGNTLGGVTSLLIGWKTRGAILRNVKSQKYQKVATWLGNYGSPILLFSWLPIVGDPLCLVAGWSSVAIFPAIVFIWIGKTLRYAAVLWVIA